MTINDGIVLTLDGKSSDEFNVGLASAFGSTSRSSSAENRNIVTTKNALGEIFNFHYANYDSPLTFDVILYNLDNTYIDAYKERELKKWLLKNKRCWLQVYQNDLVDIEYFVIATKAELLNVGTYSGCLMVEFQCDTYHAWSRLKQIKKSTVNNAITFNFNSVVDFDEYIIYPQLTIVSNANQTIQIKNNTTNETINITNCLVGETIYIDCRTDKIKSSNNTVMLDRWNKSTIGFIEGLNSISLTGNFSLTTQYRLPIRVNG
jgi:hypothetical protein